MSTSSAAAAPRRAPIVSMMTKCVSCEETVYKMEEILVDGQPLHKSCFRCQHCKRQLTLSNFAQLESKLYCKTHFLELFASSGGSYEALSGNSNRFKHNSKGVNETYGSPAEMTINSNAVPSSNASRPLPSPPAATSSKKKTKNKFEDDESSNKRDSLVRDRLKTIEQSAGNNGNKRESLDNDIDIIASRSTSMKDRMKQYQQKAGGDSSSSFSESAGVVADEAAAVDNTPISPRTNVRSSRLQNLMNSYTNNAAASSSSSNEEEDQEEEGGAIGNNEREEAKADRAQVCEEQITEDEAEEGEEDEEEVASDMPSSLKDAHAMIAKLREALIASQSETSASKAELVATEKKHEYEAAIEFAKRMEADEWCAKTSKDMESLKRQLASAKLSARSIGSDSDGGASGDDRLVRRASGTLEPMAEIAESADESDEEE